MEGCLGHLADRRPQDSDKLHQLAHVAVAVLLLDLCTLLGAEGCHLERLEGSVVTVELENLSAIVLVGGQQVRSPRPAIGVFCLLSHHTADGHIRALLHSQELFHLLLLLGACLVLLGLCFHRGSIRVVRARIFLGCLIRLHLGLLNGSACCNSLISSLAEGCVVAAILLREICLGFH